MSTMINSKQDQQNCLGQQATYEEDIVDNSTEMISTGDLIEQTPTDMSAHLLLLKKGVIIMLLRNLNPKTNFAMELD